MKAKTAFLLIMISIYFCHNHPHLQVVVCCWLLFLSLSAICLCLCLLQIVLTRGRKKEKEITALDVCSNEEMVPKYVTWTPKASVSVGVLFVTLTKEAYFYMIAIVPNLQ